MTLKKGSTGEMVKELQRRLNVEIKANLKIDGVYGDLTVAAVKVYQEKVNLKVDGVAGPCTLAALQIEDVKIELKTEDIKQFQSPWKNEIYGKDKTWGTFASSGCGCISAVICIRYYKLAGDETQHETVQRVAKVAIEKGYRVKGKGTSSGVFSCCGLKKSRCSSASAAEQALREGKLVAVCVRNGWSSYTGTGHWVVLVGIEGDCFLVRDVGSSAKSRQKVKMSDWAYVKSGYIIEKGA